MFFDKNEQFVHENQTPLPPIEMQNGNSCPAVPGVGVNVVSDKGC